MVLSCDVNLWLLVLSVLGGLYLQAEPSMLILDSSPTESSYCLCDPNGVLLLFISHRAEVLGYLQPLPLLSVSIIL